MDVAKSLSATGECNCGAVAFEITAVVSDVYICHCSICRKYTGSGGIAVVLVKNDDFHWSRGQSLVKAWDKPGHDWQATFCERCGSPLPGPDSESHTFVPAGLISTEGQSLKVAHHIWVDSKASWEMIGDSGKQHAKQFENT